MKFYRQNYWSGLPFPSPGNLPDPAIEPGSPTLQAVSFTIWATRNVPSNLVKRTNSLKDTKFKLTEGKIGNLNGLISIKGINNYYLFSTVINYLPKRKQALGVSDEQGNLVCCSPWGCKELDMTEHLNLTEKRKPQGQVNFVKFKEKITLILHILFKKIETERTLPNSFYEVSFILIPKLNRDISKN